MGEVKSHTHEMCVFGSQWIAFFTNLDGKVKEKTFHKHKNRMDFLKFLERALFGLFAINSN